MSALLHWFLLFYPFWLPVLAIIGLSFIFRWAFELIDARDPLIETDEQTIWWYAVGCSAWTVSMFVFIEVLLGYGGGTSYVEYLTRSAYILSLAYSFGLFLLVPYIVITLFMTVFLPLLASTIVLQQFFPRLSLTFQKTALVLLIAIPLSFTLYLTTFMIVGGVAQQAIELNWTAFSQFNAHLKNTCSINACPKTEDELAAFNHFQYNLLKLRTKTYYIYDTQKNEYHWFVQYTPKLVLEARTDSEFEIYYLGLPGTVPNDTKNLKNIHTTKDLPENTFLNGMPFHDAWVIILNFFRR